MSPFITALGSHFRHRRESPILAYSSKPNMIFHSGGGTLVGNGGGNSVAMGLGWEADEDRLRPDGASILPPFI
jgi:hypothetical protein